LLPASAEKQPAEEARTLGQWLINEGHPSIDNVQWARMAHCPGLVLSHVLGYDRTGIAEPRGAGLGVVAVRGNHMGHAAKKQRYGV
jgi:hypothetical protein